MMACGRGMFGTIGIPFSCCQNVRSSALARGFDMFHHIYISFPAAVSPYRKRVTFKLMMSHGLRAVFPNERIPSRSRGA